MDITMWLGYGKNTSDGNMWWRVNIEISIISKHLRGLWIYECQNG